MGMALFYVTIFRVFSGMGFGGGFCCFAGVFQGCFGKGAFFAWCFCGEFVVDSVINVVA
jgi:hypothetical protein